MKGNEIIVSANPRGRLEEGIITGTPHPGDVLEIVPGVAQIEGRFTFRQVTRATGSKGPNCVLLHDPDQGGTNLTQYASGSHVQVYWPMAGDELNMRVTDKAGTTVGNSIAIGDLLSVETGTGHVVPLESFGYASAPFQALEAVVGSTVSADYLLWVHYFGDQA